MPISKLLSRPLNIEDAAYVLGISRNTLKKYAEIFDLKSEEPEGRRQFCPVKIERFERFLGEKKYLSKKQLHITKKSIYL